MRTVRLAVTLLVAAGVAWAQPGGERLHFPVGGFSIEPSGASWTLASEQPLILSLAPVDGFAPNVNVMVQPFAGSMQQYLELTNRQLRAAGLEWVTEPVVDGDAMTCEYAGSMEGRALHFYARIRKREDRFYMVTATSPSGHWETLRAPLVETVDSFRLEEPQ